MVYIVKAPFVNNTIKAPFVNNTTKALFVNNTIKVPIVNNTIKAHFVNNTIKAPFVNNTIQAPSIIIYRFSKGAQLPEHQLDIKLISIIHKIITKLRFYFRISKFE
jgi:hypothetical protein